MAATMVEGKLLKEIRTIFPKREAAPQKMNPEAEIVIPARRYIKASEVEEGYTGYAQRDDGVLVATPFQ